MVVGINPASHLKEISEKEKIAFTDALFNYTYGDLTRRIVSSKYSDTFPIMKKALEQKTSKIYLFFQRSRKTPELTKELVNEYLNTTFLDPNEIEWKYKVVELEDVFLCNLLAEYKEMDVPFVVKIIKTTKEEEKFYNYATENELCKNFLEIMEKLELIGDMRPYFIMNETLKNKTISGRYVMEIVSANCESKPKILNEKRIDKIESYKDYSYMSKRWQQFCKRKGYEAESWEEVITRITEFGTPIWKALCSNEIFFDDWMPELGRFLG